MVGSMGCVSSLALGLCLARKDKNVIAIDGDGAIIDENGQPCNQWLLQSR